MNNGSTSQARLQRGHFTLKSSGKHQKRILCVQHGAGPELSTSLCCYVNLNLQFAVPFTV